VALALARNFPMSVNRLKSLYPHQSDGTCAAATAVPAAHATPTTSFRAACPACIGLCRLPVQDALPLFVRSGFVAYLIYSAPFLELLFLIAFQSVAIARVAHLVPTVFCLFPICRDQITVQLLGALYTNTIHGCR
jgi:hypothetical protein